MPFPASPFLQALPVRPAALVPPHGAAAFTQRFSAPRALLRLTGHSLYQVFLNGEFLACGPARAAHGFHYVDELTLTGAPDGGENTLTVILYHLDVPCFAGALGPAFLCAELMESGAVTAATGVKGFSCVSLPEKRLYAVPRYSMQRGFCEIYAPAEPGAEAPVVPAEAGQFLPRAVPHPEYPRSSPARLMETGAFTLDGGAPERRWHRYERFPRHEVVFDPLQLAARLCLTPGEPSLENGYARWDLGRELTGFFQLDVRCERASRLIVTFDEILTRGQIDPARLSCVNVLVWDLAPGEHRLVSMEPYSLRYVQAALAGRGEVTGLTIIRYEYPTGRLLPAPPLPEALIPVWQAAVDTFLQNAPDIFMDCPSRERAGWLCDSFFAGRAEFALTGKSEVERAFLNNFLLPPAFEYLPAGMLPMCYPADHPDGNFIPNWAMWFVLELEEYLARSGDRALIDRAEARVMALIDYFAPFKNELGLLEDLEKWVFVEWSHSNDLTQNVNFPSNMLFSAMLDAAARLYDRPELAAEAKKMRRAIRETARLGEFYGDNALRTPEGLALSGERTETCQYYAFFTGVAAPETDQALFDILVRDFGPARDAEAVWPDIAPSNAFIGDYLRLEMLLKSGLKAQALSEIVAYFSPMAAATGTLWENNDARASCNHGFAASAADFIRRCEEMWKKGPSVS